jgi:hypothetical protein
MPPPFESYTTIVRFVITQDFFFISSERSHIRSFPFKYNASKSFGKKLNLTTKNKHLKNLPKDFNALNALKNYAIYQYIEFSELLADFFSFTGMLA